MPDDIIVYPKKLLKFTSLSWHIGTVSRSGGRTIIGTEQVVHNPGGVWVARLTPSIGAMSWNGSDELLLYQGFLADMRGRFGVCALPYFDARGSSQLLGYPLSVPHSDGTTFSDGSMYVGSGIPAILGAAASKNDTAVTISIHHSVNIYPGQVFSFLEKRMHRIRRIIARDTNTITVGISPWLRNNYALGTEIRVDRPENLMRFASDDTGMLTIQAGEAWASPTLDFVEYL